LRAVEVEVPLKQGLKPKKEDLLREIERIVEVEVPLKQGLKPI